MKFRWAATLLLFLTAILAAPVSAQIPGLTPSAPAAPAVPQDPLGRSTPRGAVIGFLNVSRRGDHDGAVQYLETRLRSQASADLASQLYVVLDRRLPPRLNQIIEKPEGSLLDPANPNRELVGTISSQNGDVPIYLDRVDRGKNGPIWLFSERTLDAVPDLYEEINTVPVESYVPGPLVSERLLGVPLYEWLAVCVGLPLLYLLTVAVNWIFGLGAGLVWRRVRHQQDLPNPVVLPQALRLLFLALVIRWLLGKVTLSLMARQFWSGVAAVLIIAGFTWLFALLTEKVEERIRLHLVRRNLSGPTSIVRLVRRTMDVLAIFIALLVGLRYFGMNPTAALAGLGVGGIAVALAAQKTLENVIGGISLILDQPARIGDFCRIGAIEGTVEDFGLRSTRIRTLDRTLVSVPNGQLATMNLENLTFRDKFWFHPILGLRYETTAAQIRQITQAIHELLASQSRIEQDSIRVRFIRFGAYSLDVEVFAYVYARDWNHYLEIQEELSLQIMDLVQAAGAQLAFPSQTMYMASDSAAGGKAAGPEQSDSPPPSR